jgi:hypothetical protein
MWAPVIAPVKYPGLSNDYFCAVSGGGDNALYYGGMALALFSLEVKHGVSDYSINYARKLVTYILSSEMIDKNGYLIKRNSFFGSDRNPSGEPIIQGAGPEDLLGTMLGLMYYLRVEDPTYPLYREAKELRDRILERVPKESDACIGGYPVKPAKYEHPFMLSAKEPRYPISHLAFPLYASAGVKLKYKLFLSCQPQKEYENLLKGAAGWSRNLTGIFSDMPFKKYSTYLTSIILVLGSDESAVSGRIKEHLSEMFMEEFIMASVTSGLDTDNLRNNAYLGVVARMINKHLNEQRDSEMAGPKLKNIWGDDIDKWEILMSDVNNTILNATSDATRKRPLIWQHNLPLMTPIPGEGDINIENFWKDHNTDGKTGGVFVWQHPHPYRFEMPAGKWYGTFPGWDSDNVLNESEYLLAPDSNTYSRTRYTQFRGFQGGYLDKELRERRRHQDQQVEGAGLDFLFLRMLLTEINPETFPPPTLPGDYDRDFSVLPLPGVEPMHPQLLHYLVENPGRNNARSQAFTVYGDHEKTLQIIKLKAHNDTHNNFVLASADEDKTLKLTEGFVNTEQNISESISGTSIHLSSEDITWKHFDKAVLARTEDNAGNNVLILAERAEQKSISGKTCNHWLRLSLWKVSTIAEEDFHSMDHVSTWESNDRHCDNVKDLDITMMDNNHLAVSSINRRDRTYLDIFRIDPESNTINHLLRKRAGGAGQKNTSITSVFDNIIAYPSRDPYLPSQSYLYTGTLESNDLTVLSRSPLDAGTILDIATIEDHVVAVGIKNDHLMIYSWKVNHNGELDFKGQFHVIHDRAEDNLLGSEAGWEAATVSPVSWEDRAGFIIAGNGAARELRNVNGTWIKSAKGLKVVYGYVMDDGRPTIESSTVTGSGLQSSIGAFDITESISSGDSPGILTAHRTHDNTLKLVLWTFRDNLGRIRAEK